MTRIDNFEGSTEEYIQYLETLVVQLRGRLGHPASVPTTPISLPLAGATNPPSSVQTSNAPASESVVNAGGRHNAAVDDATDEEGIGDWTYDSSRLTVLQTALPIQPFIVRPSHLFFLVNQGRTPAHSLLLGPLMTRRPFKQDANGPAGA